MTMTTQNLEMTAVGTASRSENRGREDSRGFRKKLDSYAALEYPIELVPDGGMYVASNPDLPGCVSMGATPDEAVDSLAKVRELWIEGQLAAGNPIPDPSKAERYSGKFVLRIPKLLHRMADYRARQEGTSLNSFIAAILAGALNYPMSQQGEGGVKEKGGILRLQARHEGHWYSAPTPSWKIEVSGKHKHPYQIDFSGARLVLGCLVDTIRDHNKSTYQLLPRLEDYHRAEEETNFQSK